MVRVEQLQRERSARYAHLIALLQRPRPGLKRQHHLELVAELVAGRRGCCGPRSAATIR